MLVFATELPLRESRTIEELLDVVRTWILGSQHTHFTHQSFPQLPPDGEEVTANAFGDSVTIARATADSGEAVGGVLYVQAEVDGVQWSTEVVGAHTAGRLTVGVRVSCESRAAMPALPPPKKPVVVRMLLERLGGGADGDIVVMEQPCRLDRRPSRRPPS